MTSYHDKSSIDKGREWENRAEEYLEKKGYTILETNWRSSRQEIDLIARIDNTIVFVEVKGVSTDKFGHPAERVDKRKRENLIKAAGNYISANSSANLDYRFDLITFFEGKLEHYPNAFQVEE